ncbi:MAG: hypothetical protein ACYDHX_10085 [Methanothrix sp.]
MTAPFEGLLGDTSELRTIQFLLPVKGLEFNISELARGTGITRQTMIRIVRKFAKWNILCIASKHAGVNYYALNRNSGFIGAFENLDNRIIEQMLDTQTLAKIAADHSIDQSCSGTPPVQGTGIALAEPGKCPRVTGDLSI